MKRDKNIKLIISKAVLAVLSTLIIPPVNASSASNQFTSICNKSGGYIKSNVLIKSYISSMTQQDTYTAVVSNDNTSVWQISGITNLTSAEHDSNSVQTKQLAYAAFMTGKAINLCASSSSTPHSIKALEMAP